MLVGRILLAAIFIFAGYGKLGAYDATQAYMASQGVPGMLLPLVILLELGGGIAIVLGLFTRLTAVALAGFCVASALLFHSNAAEQMQAVMFMKNLAMAGGFLILAAHGPGDISLDNRNSRPASD
ncbi:MAG: DoxX family protein [Nevskiales bacterium]